MQLSDNHEVGTSSLYIFTLIIGEKKKKKKKRDYTNITYE